MDYRTKNEEHRDDDPVELLRMLYPYIGTAISLELEHGNYQEIEKLKELRRRIEKLIL